MAEPAEFRPDELDRIEDALESLELADTVTDASPHVAARLREYQQLLVASRDALPLQEVPVGLLDGVLAEARQAQPALEPAPTPAAKPSFWQRFRRTFLIPVTALAGTAALVLFIARPDPDNEEVTAAKPGPAATDAAAPQRAGAPPPESAMPAAPEPEPAAELEEVPAEDPGDMDNVRGQLAEEDVPAPGSAAASTPTQAPAKMPAMDPLGNAEGGEPALDRQQKNDAKPEEPQIPPGWDLIDRADDARQRGDCRSARMDYNIATEDDDAAVRARAYMGLGLCDNAAGNADAAEENFAKARGEDGAVAPLIENETNKPYRPAAKKSKRSKSKPKARSSFDKADPFNGL